MEESIKNKHFQGITIKLHLHSKLFLQEIKYQMKIKRNGIIKLKYVVEKLSLPSECVTSSTCQVNSQLVGNIEEVADVCRWIVLE